ncbi:PD-(D/E)XK nuclease family protein [Ideonella alba]|uniref:PD-(D/E)XK nuclease family protein n=1 Tax=Ideonella alba TaxID=2824118 RepID=A0A940YI79_9BURK|nr:PD-(D/E)XK nuclease family protein [Ideonella alba]MBQ0932907.1 PD-(D/E)XK nuclease family protein [Ideonella alba]
MTAAPPETTPLDEHTWARLADQVGDWAQARGVVLRDAIWLLPFTALLPQARRAFARRGGWAPRIETVATLAPQLGPRAPAAAEAMAGDTVTRRLQVAAQLRGVDQGGWARRDPAGFAWAVAAVVDTADEWQQALAAQPPSGRAAWVATAQARLAGGTGPGDQERSLAGYALAWAARSIAVQPPASDALYEARPSAWIGLRAGGTVPLVQAVLDEAAARGVPVLWLDQDPPPERLFEAAATLPPPQEHLADDAEGEARAAAVEVLDALRRHEQGAVALIAQDREAVRRVRALLERAAVEVVDDTGWRVATTRAGARAMALLRAARALSRPSAGAEDLWLAWLKDDPAFASQAEELRVLEALWRGRRLSPARRDQAQAFWERAQSRLAPLREPARRPLAEWLSALAALWLDDPASAAAWRDDPAGRAVLAAWRLEAPWNQGAGWPALAAATRFTLDELISWADEALSEASVVPDHPPQARVVITPLARAMLRPFVAAVLPGADEQRLGGHEPGVDLIGPALRRALGLPGVAEAAEREALAFIQALRLPNLCLVRRRAEGSEPLGPSPLLQRLVLARGGQALPVSTLAPPCRAWAVQPVAEPAVMASGARWPDSLSASAVDAWRDCPYRFFAQRLLGLASDDELDRLAEKRDYGDWLHAVLLRFHEQRAAGARLDDDRALLRRCAQEVAPDGRLAEGEMLPYLASFDRLCEPYLAWLQARDQAGWRWTAGEIDRQRPAPALGAMGLHGRLDRLDSGPGGAVQVIDYKTGRADELKRRAKGLEDTQLAFYAALAVADGATVGAAYLALDERDGPRWIEHADVLADAERLLGELAAEFDRARAGEPLRALGRGQACEYCDMRGLCRRDHWAAPPDTAAEAVTDSGGDE